MIYSFISSIWILNFEWLSFLIEHTTLVLEVVLFQDADHIFDYGIVLHAEKVWMFFFTFLFFSWFAFGRLAGVVFTFLANNLIFNARNYKFCFLATEFFGDLGGEAWAFDYLELFTSTWLAVNHLNSITFISILGFQIFEFNIYFIAYWFEFLLIYMIFQ